MLLFYRQGVTLLDIETKIEKTRSILNNAIESKANYATILEISRRLDQYIIKYIKEKSYDKKSHSNTINNQYSHEK